MLVSRSTAPLLGLVVADEPVDVPDELSSPVGLEPEEPPVADDPPFWVLVPVWVLVPLGTVLLPLPPEVALPDEAPPVGDAAPPPTTEGTKVVPLIGAWGLTGGAAGRPVGGPAGTVATVG